MLNILELAEDIAPSAKRVAGFAEKPKKVQKSGTASAKKSARQAEISRKIANESREIGALPPVKNPDNRESFEFDLEGFCQHYGPKTFYMPFGMNHLELIEYLMGVILDGEKQSLALPRGTGKSSLCKWAIAWGIVYGHIKYAVIIAANDKLATKIMRDVKKVLQLPDIVADFPEVCYPIKALDNIAHRCPGQLLEGRPTNMKWNDKEIVLPTVEGSKASGSRLSVAGITGSGIRGLAEMKDDGEILRPDVVLIDDFQTKDSARSQGDDGQCQKLLDIITNDIAGMKGPGKPMGIMIPCTIIEANDAAEAIVDPKKYPEFNGMRVAMLSEMPEYTTAWTEEYHAILKKCHEKKVAWKKEQAKQKALERQKRCGKERIGRNKRKPKDPMDFYVEANEYYLKNREKMDAGFKASWPERTDGWVSAIQYAMNLFLENEKLFWCEYQNDPGQMIDESDIRLNKGDILGNLNGYDRYEQPEGFGYYTFGIDLNDYGFNTAQCFWRHDMTGVVADYYEYTPEDPATGRPRGYVYKKDNNMVRAVEYALALEKLLRKIHVEHPEASIGVDGNYQTKTVHDVVQKMRRMGVKVEIVRGVSYKRFREPDRGNKKLIKRGEKCHLWMGPKGREIVMESDWWHMTTQGGFKIQNPNRGSLSLWGRKWTIHESYALECCNDIYKQYNPDDYNNMYVKSSMGGRNDKFDATSIAQIVANIEGASFDADITEAGKKKKKVKLSELQKSKRR